MEKGTTEDEMVASHQRLNGHEFEYMPGFGDGQGRTMGSLLMASLFPETRFGESKA